MLRKNLNDSATACISEFVPLEVSSGMIEYCVKFVADKLIRGEDAYALRIVDEYLVKHGTDRLHTAGFSCPVLDTFIAPEASDTHRPS